MEENSIECSKSRSMNQSSEEICGSNSAEERKVEINLQNDKQENEIILQNEGLRRIKHDHSQPNKDDKVKNNKDEEVKTGVKRRKSNSEVVPSKKANHGGNTLIGSGNQEKKEEMSANSERLPTFIDLVNEDKYREPSENQQHLEFQVTENKLRTNEKVENVANGDEIFVIVRAQGCKEEGGMLMTNNSQNRGGDVQSQRRRMRRRRAVQSNPEEIAEGDVEEVIYERITPETVPRKMSKSWRNVPKYKLTVPETIQQEADLYFSFLQENNPEDVNVVEGQDDKACCVCYEYKATRIVLPCGHLCLCYNCTRSITLNRTKLSTGRIAKKCPLCQAAISKIIRIL